MAAMAVATPIEQKVWKFGHQGDGRQELPVDAVGAPHEIHLRVALKDGSLYLTCICKGGKFAWAGDETGRGCWAMKIVRRRLHLA